MKAFFVAKTAEAGKDTLNEYILSDLDPYYNKELTHMCEEPGKVYEGKDTNHDRGDFIKMRSHFKEFTKTKKQLRAYLMINLRSYT